MDRTAQIAAGFAPLHAPAEVKARAAGALATWLAHPEYAQYRPQLDWLIAENRWSFLLDSFYQVLPFGTGGRRGSVGIGPNRMNLWTLGASVQGHCEYLRQRFPKRSELVVVLAYDVRQFHDTKGVYNPSLPNPVIGLTSRQFCEHAAGVYAANGVVAVMLPEGSSRYTPTPELSYSIRSLGAQGGLNMTASHNPPDDNGSKFYDERGAQPVPPDDQLMSDLVDQVKEIRHVPFAEALRMGRVRPLPESVHRDYIEVCRKQSLVAPPKADELRVVFTPLHGEGGFCAGETLLAQGFKYIEVSEQNTPDGRFPNVTKSPNPEVRESMDRAEVVAVAHKADIVISTDPDADRIGCLAFEAEGRYRFVTGNEIASLLTYFKLSRLSAAGSLPASAIVITTEVTTGLITRIARSYSAQVINDLLVGFKYHADVLWQLESEGRYGEVEGSPADFVIATEESHGALCTAEIRDKDSAAAALLLAELSLYLKRQERTIPGLLDDLSRQFGYYRNELLNLTMTGLEGKQDMTKMLNALRTSPPATIGGMAVASAEDLQDEDGRMGPFKGDTDKAARNFLIFRLQGAGGVDAKVCLRPSGTEPKAKAYLEVNSAPHSPGMPEAEWQSTRSKVDERIQALASDFLKAALGTVGQTPAAGADRLPPAPKLGGH